jgi:hypothetical protein
MKGYYQKVRIYLCQSFLCARSSFVFLISIYYFPMQAALAYSKGEKSYASYLAEEVRLAIL